MADHPSIVRSDARRRTARRTRVLHVISSLHGGGAERVLLTLLDGLPEVSQTLAVAGAGALLPLVPRSVPIRSAGTALALAELMVRVRPDVVHTWLDDSLLMTVAAAAQLAVPIVHRIYNVPSLQAAYEPSAPDRRGRMARALSAATRVVALSATAADDAARFYGIEPPQVIYNGFPLAGARAANSAPIARADGRFVILSVARLAPEKGQATLIEAVRRIARAHPQVDVWLAGIGPLEGELRRQAADAGLADRVTFLGFREDVSRLHAAADLFVFPSLTEGFGNAFGEALVGGLPIVASDLPVIRRELLGGAPAAWLHPPGDASALAVALEALVSDAGARARLAAHARAAGARFAVGAMLDAYRSLYARLAEETRAAA